MNANDLLNFPTHFALVFFRIAGLMVFAPLIGSGRIPQRMKFYFAGVLTLAMAGSMPAPALMPETPWHLAVGIGGELVFGLALGQVLSLVFVAAQYGGSIAGQQMGFNLAGSLDPSSDIGSNPLGDVYFMLTLFVFLLLDGHHAMMLGVRNSFDYLPPMSAGVHGELLGAIASMVMSATTLAVRIAAPACVAMLVVDLALGMIGKTIPQMNLLSVGMSVRLMAGIFVVVVGLGLTGIVLSDAINDGLTLAERLWLLPR